MHKTRKKETGKVSSKVIIALAAVGLLALIVIVVGRYNASKNRGTEVQVEKVQLTAQLVAKVSATGEIQPKEFVELQSEIIGIVTAIYAKEGDSVRKGDPLIKIDPKQLELQTRAEKAGHEMTVADANNQKAQIRVQETVLQRDQANLRKTEAELNKAQQNYDIAKRAFDRKQQMFEDKLISRDTYDAAKNDLIAAETALTTSETSVSQAEAQLAVTEVGLEQERIRYQNTLRRIDQSRANLERTQDQFSKTLIRAPLSGVITKMNVEVGERAVPGTLDNPAATLMIIADLSVIEAEVEVDETDIVNVEIGQAAVVNVDALPERPLQGQVTEVGSSALQAVGQEAKDFKVVIQLDNPPKSLRPGLSCTADITTATREGVLSIPIQALTVREFAIDESGELIRTKKARRGAERKKDSSEDGAGESEEVNEKKEIEGVFRIEEGKARFVKVETGITGETKIEVKKGLEEGETIVVGSYKALRNLDDDDEVVVERKDR